MQRGLKTCSIKYFDFIKLVLEARHHYGFIFGVAVNKVVAFNGSTWHGIYRFVLLEYFNNGKFL
jgi:hypothetical protein